MFYMALKRGKTGSSLTPVSVSKSASLNALIMLIDSNVVKVCEKAKKRAGCTAGVAVVNNGQWDFIYYNGSKFHSYPKLITPS